MFDLLKKGKPFLNKYKTTILDILGGILITIGIFLFSIPIGFIFAGIACFIISSRLPENGGLNGEYSEKHF